MLNALQESSPCLYQPVLRTQELPFLLEHSLHNMWRWGIGQGSGQKEQNCHLYTVFGTASGNLDVKSVVSRLNT